MQQRETITATLSARDNLEWIVGNEDPMHE